MYFRPSWTSWWARQTNSILLIWLNCIEKRPSSKQNQLYIVINKRKKYLLSHPCSKEPTCSAGTNCPCINLFWVAPHQITERPFMRNFTIAINYLYLETTKIWNIHETQNWVSILWKQIWPHPTEKWNHRVRYLFSWCMSSTKQAFRYMHGWLPHFFHDKNISSSKLALNFKKAAYTVNWWKVSNW